MFLVCLYIILIAPLYLLTFGPKVSEILLLDIDTGPIQTVMLLGYTLSMVFNGAMILVPMFDIGTQIRKKFIAKGFYARVDSSDSPRVKFGPFTRVFMQISSNQVVFQAITVAAIMMLVSMAPNISFSMLLNASLCTNFFQVIIPNWMAVKAMQEIE